VKRMKWLAPAFALVLAGSALFAGHVPVSSAQQGQRDPYSSRKPACGCYVCGKLLAVMFEDMDCAGILAADACGKRLANLPKEERDGFCQKIKATFKFNSFKDSCPVYAPYCGPEEKSKSGPTQPDKSSGSKRNQCRISQLAADCFSQASEDIYRGYEAQITQDVGPARSKFNLQGLKDLFKTMSKSIKDNCIKQDEAEARYSDPLSLSVLSAEIVRGIQDGIHSELGRCFQQAQKATRSVSSTPP
jgi:hypothetical protein